VKIKKEGCRAAIYLLAGMLCFVTSEISSLVFQCIPLASEPNITAITDTTTRKITIVVIITTRIKKIIIWAVFVGIKGIS